MPARRHFGSVRRLSSGRWQARYRTDDGRMASGGTLPTRRDAERWLAGVETDLARGEHEPPGTATVGELARCWLETVAPGQARSEQTIEHYRGIVERHLIPALGEVAVGELSAAQVDDWLVSRAHLARSYVGRMRSTLAQILRHAQRRGVVRSNAAALAVVRSSPQPRQSPSGRCSASGYASGCAPASWPGCCGRTLTSTQTLRRPADAVDHRLGQAPPERLGVAGLRAQARHGRAPHPGPSPYRGGCAGGAQGGQRDQRRPGLRHGHGQPVQPPPRLQGVCAGRPPCGDRRRLPLPDAPLGGQLDAGCRGEPGRGSRRVGRRTPRRYCATTATGCDLWPREGSAWATCWAAVPPRRAEQWHEAPPTVAR